MPLSEPQGDRALVALRRRLEVTHAGDVAALARELRALPSVLAQVLSGRVLCPRGLALALARVVGVTMDVLLAGPREEAAQLSLIHISEPTRPCH
jgi:DNA-binding transcriptional regulator YdaS (Cro superfamily)